MKNKTNNYGIRFPYYFINYPDYIYYGTINDYGDGDGSFQKYIIDIYVIYLRKLYEK